MDELREYAQGWDDCRDAITLEASRLNQRIQLFKSLCRESLRHLQHTKVNHYSLGHQESLEERLSAALGESK